MTVDESFDSGLSLQLRQQHPIPLQAEFSCRKGELVALVGPSGSGKSTILRAIAGLNSPQFGEVTCQGEVWLDTTRNFYRSTQQRRIGMVFQEPALFPHMSVVDNIIVALDHVPKEKRRARATDWLERVNLGGLEKRKPSTLSGGQQQRVALARALAREPEVLLLDEPFSAVDRVTRRKLQSELVALRQHIDIPVVLVTHDLEEATLLADKICVLHHGKTLDFGVPDRIMTQPASSLVARLVDLPNIYQGVIERLASKTSPAQMRWNNIVLEIADNFTAQTGEQVSWTIPPSFVVLHRRRKPSKGERENPVTGRVTQILTFNEISRITVKVEGTQDCSLVLSLDTHAARRNKIHVGEVITVSLLAQDIHIMAAGED
jgi:molybdate transport system ATP-binding protein